MNGGYLRQPYIVQEVLDSKGNVTYEHDSTPIRQVISEETSQRVCNLLEGVVDGGTGKNAYVAGYRIGGKTGTADKTGTKTADNPKGDIVVSFVGVAPFMIRNIYHFTCAGYTQPYNRHLPQRR